MALKIATWNVNSVRLRQDLVRRLVAAEAPDVLCLQETKVRDELFPRETFVELGYRHMLIHGMKGYNGVAVLSRIPLKSHGTRGWCEREDCAGEEVGRSSASSSPRRVAEEERGCAGGCCFW